MFALPSMRYDFNGILGMGIRDISDEDFAEYGDKDNGMVELYTIGGKDKGVKVTLNANVYNGSGDVIKYTDLNANNYTVTIKDLNNGENRVIHVIIGYNGAGSSVTYNGTTFLKGNEFWFF